MQKMLLTLLRRLRMAVAGQKEGLARKAQAPRYQSRFTYVNGPMMFIGQQIVRQMQSAGWDPKINCCYRSPDDQAKLKARGRSKAGPFRSPHQYWLAVDICDRTKGWQVPDDFWDDLHAAASVVEERYGLVLEHGYDWGWDKAHIELKSFRDWRDLFGERVLVQHDLDFMFAQVLPDVWKQYLNSAQAQARGLFPTPKKGQQH